MLHNWVANVDSALFVLKKEYLKKDFFVTTKPKKHLDARIRTDKFS